MAPRTSVLAFSAAAAALVLLTLPVDAGARKLRPVDESGRDPSLRRFLAGLRETVRRRDRAGLMRVLHPKVELSFGGHQGTADFRSMWHPERRESEIWPTLAWILAHGGSFFEEEGQRSFWMPCVFSEFPDDLDAFEGWQAVVGRRVRLRASPGIEGRVKAHLSYDLVRVLHEGNNWSRVRLPGGREGWVARRYLRGPIDYRAGFRKVNGEWKLEALLAGD
ncbi:MAG: SH3 domain-containing protein [Armatimonadota bacterium]